MTGVAQSWLDIQCGIIPGVKRAIVMRPTGNAKLYKKSAVWPADMSKIPDGLSKAVSQAASRNTAVVRNLKGQGEDEKYGCIIAAPLGGEHEDLGVAALEITGKGKIKTQDVLRYIRWGSIWLNLLHKETHHQTSKDRLSTLVEILVGSLEHEQFRAASKKAVNDLASHLDCDRVSLGLLKGRRIHVHAISHTVSIDNRSNLNKVISSAMEEAIDQDVTVVFPPLHNRVTQVSFSQEVLFKNNDGRAVCSTPLYNNGKAVGAITFELANEQAYTTETLELCESLGALLGPVLELKYQNDRWLLSRLWDRGIRALKDIFGFRYFTLKIVFMLFAIGMTYITMITAEYRVRATATLEPASKQVITAPQAGFIVAVSARAGDRVKQGDLLTTLDDKELKLEQLQLRSEYDQYVMERRAGLMDVNERARVAVAAAQIKQAEAKLRLLNEKLERTTITAPFDGVIVTGDLEELLGTPLEPGQALFEIAPDKQYRLRIEVDERDIGDIVPGHRGELLLTSMPDKSISFEVNRLLPVSQAREGKNMFEVEASLKQDDALFRPGMEGVAKINIEQRRLIAIWFHKLIHWGQLQLWYWLG